MKTEIEGDTQMCRCARAGRHTDEDIGEFSVVNEITGSWRVRSYCRCYFYCGCSR